MMIGRRQLHARSLCVFSRPPFHCRSSQWERTQLAGLIGVIAGMSSEMRNARPEERGEIAATQKLELQAMRSQILRPNQFATEGDPLREARGGPGGQSGKEMVDLLTLISNTLKSIDGKSGGLGP
jgi:hypothetical protein